MNKLALLIVLFMTWTLATNAQLAKAEGEFNKLLMSYFETKNALAKDNAVKAGESSKVLVASLDHLQLKALSEPQKSLWKLEAEKIKKAALEISTEKEIKVQRQSFWPLSIAMVKLARMFNLNNKEMYVQYCPMAKKSWLNEVEAIQNPFYGSMMYDCGEVKEILLKK